MKLMFRLTLLFLIVISLAGLTIAHDERINLADFASNPAAFTGRTVEVQARIIAINADGKSLELYDSPTRTRISVQLAQLSKADRKALIRSDTREVLVRGQVSIVAGRMTIHAESIQWSDKEASK
jgi:hypothetical protein